MTTKKPSECLPTCHPKFFGTLDYAERKHDPDCPNDAPKPALCGWGSDPGMHAKGPPVPKEPSAEPGEPTIGCEIHAKFEDFLLAPIVERWRFERLTTKEPSAGPDSIDRAINAARERGWIGFEESFAFEITTLRAEVEMLNRRPNIAWSDIEQIEHEANKLAVAFDGDPFRNSSSVRVVAQGLLRIVRAARSQGGQPQ